MPQRRSTNRDARLRIARSRRHRRGSILVLALLMIVACLAAAALAIDVAYMQLVQTQLRSATDAATRAGAEGLAEGMSLGMARKLAKDVAELNIVAGSPLKLSNEDIVFGRAEPNPADPAGRYLFTPSSTGVNALRVQGRRTPGSPSGSVPLFLGSRLFGTGPFQPAKAATASIADRDIVLVLDRSGSMHGEDAGDLPPPLRRDYADPIYDDDADGHLRRIEALKVAVGEFRKVLDDLPSTEFLGLVSYSTNSTTEVDLDGDYTMFDARVRALPASGYTNIGEGIDDAAEMLQNVDLIRPSAAPVIILMTDGLHNQARDPEDAARDAMAALPRLTIHSVTFSTGADIPRMQSVAAIGGGIHVHANDVSQLVDEFEEMAHTAGVRLLE